MLRIIRGQSDNNEQIYRRFKKGIKEARYVMALKKARFHKKAPTGRQIRAAAIMREHYRKVRQKQQFAL